MEEDLFSYLGNTTNATAANFTIKHSPPTFTTNVLMQVIVYSILLVIASAGNLTVLTTLLRGRHRKSRISLMILHLTIADLIVTLIMIPLEIGWRITVQWTAGNFFCKLFAVLRAFGLYLSSNVLVCVSMDRYFAILHPLRVSDAQRRGKLMLLVAWLFSMACAFPQCLVFHELPHPGDPTFHQCVTFGSFSSTVHEQAYNFFCVAAMYFIPLFVIVFAYSCILWEISSKSRETKEDNRNLQNRNYERHTHRGRMQLRRSDMSNIERARTRTLRMTITIVAAFVWCWTPYVVMAMWYIIDRNSASKVDSRVQDILFIMAVSNSCMNPIVYGSFAMNLPKDCCWFRSQYLNRQSTSRRHHLYLNTNQGYTLRPYCTCCQVKSTATKTTTFNDGRRRKFTFSANPLHGVAAPGTHSECLPIDEDRDSGVSISYRGRPYHSEPIHPAINGEATGTGFCHGLEGHHLSGTEFATSRESIHFTKNNNRLHSFTINNLAFHKN